MIEEMAPFAGVGYMSQTFGLLKHAPRLYTLK
jgi:hypothetical protein